MRKAVAALAIVGYLLAPRQSMATGPGTVTFPNTLNYGATFGSGGEYHSTTALVDINNPANGATVSGGALSVAITGTPSFNCASGCGGGGGGGGSVSNTGAAVPAQATYLGVNVGGTLTGLTASVSGLKVDGSAVTQPVSLVSLPPLAAGSNTIGAVTLSAGSNTIGAVTISGTPSFICSSGCSGGGGGGGTSSNFAAAFPTAGTAIGVKNGSNMVNLTADGSSNLNVDVAAGTVGLNDDGSVTGGTAASKSALVGCQFNSTAPTLTNGQQAACQSNASGAIEVTGGLSDGASATGVLYSPVAGRGSTGIQKIVTCDSYAKYDASTSGDTQIVALSGSTKIYICGYSIHTGGTATNVKFDVGTGTNCATGTTALTPAWQLLANAGRVEDGAFWNGLSAPAGDALCINASAANAVQAEVWYAQF